MDRAPKLIQHVHIEWRSMWITNFDIKAFEWPTYTCEFNTLCVLIVVRSLGKFVSID